MRSDSHSHTAYRMLKVFMLLCQKPQTLGELQHALEKDAEIGKSLSQDAIGLYMKTLKMLGCQIDRPKKSNLFHYTLKSHPFSYQLTPENYRLLLNVKTQIEDFLDFDNYFYFCQWINNVLTNTYPSNEQTKWLQEIFEPITNFELVSDTISKLQKAISLKQVLEVTYQSNLKNCRNIYFLPHQLSRKKNVFYASGATQDKNGILMLRIDKIKAIKTEISLPSEVIQSLQAMAPVTQKYLIRIIDCKPENYLPFEGTEIIKQIDGDLLIKVQTDNRFMLKQHLFSLQHAFNVLYPKSFANELLTTLDAMKKLYLSEQEFGLETGPSLWIRKKKSLTQSLT